MITTKKHTRVLSLILAVLMLMSISVTGFAADAEFAYYFADKDKTEIYVTGFKGSVPADGIVEIPDEIDGYTVVGIAEHTFDNLQDLRVVIIPATVTDIDEDAFYNCNGIVDVQVKNPDEIDIGDDVFDSTEWYEEHKQDYVISGTTLVSYKGNDEIVTVPYNCTMIADGAFKNNKKIKTVYIEKDIKTIGKNAFAGCTSLENVVVGDGVGTVKIGKDAFTGTPWLANYPSTFVIIGTTLVKYKGADSSVLIPNVVTAIADEAFYVGEANEGIAFKVRVPISVKEFGEECFYLYDSASKVYPEVLVYEGSAAEEYCKVEGLHYQYAPLPGDADLNGKVTAVDARYVLRLAAKLENPQIAAEVKEAADITADGKIGADDARMILRIAANLEKYDVNALLMMPRTDYEVLLTAANAMSIAKAYRCAYSKISYQEISALNMNANTKTYLNRFQNELTSEKKAETITYNQDTDEAYNNLFDITLLDASKIESYICSLNDGVYNIKIVLKDETINGKDVDAVSYTQKMFPVETVAHYTNAIQNKYWYNADKFDYDMTYHGCTLEMSVNADTMKLNSVTLTMNYNFSITGEILGIKISGDKNKPATATRTDTVKYSNFVYFTK